MNNFQINQKVVCIDDDWPRFISYVQHWPRKDYIYQVRTLNIDNNKVFIRLHEIVNLESDKRYEPEFWAECFRPVVERKTDIEIFRRLLVQSKVVV